METFLFSYLAVIYFTAKVLKVNFSFVIDSSLILEQRKALKTLFRDFELEPQSLYYLDTDLFEEIKKIMDHLMKLAYWLFNGYDEINDLSSLTKRIKSFSLFMANVVKNYSNGNKDALELFKEIIPEFDHDYLSYLTNFKLISDEDRKDDEDDNKQIKDVKRFSDNIADLIKVNTICYAIYKLILNFLVIMKYYFYIN